MRCSHLGENSVFIKLSHYNSVIISFRVCLKLQVFAQIRFIRIHTLFPVIWVIKYFIKWKAETKTLQSCFVVYDFCYCHLTFLSHVCLHNSMFWNGTFMGQGLHFDPSDRTIVKMMRARRGFAADIYHIHRCFKQKGKKKHQEKFSLHPSYHRYYTFCTKGSTLFLHHQDYISQVKFT
jgi:hypothetical protein